MRALLACISLVACDQHVPEATYEQVQENYGAPITAPERNIETIGAQGMCDAPDDAVTDDQDGLSVTYCDHAPRVSQRNTLLIVDDDQEDRAP